jgi:predicted dehydrogenase
MSRDQGTNRGTDRRSFIKTSAVMAASAGALSTLSYEDVSADAASIPVTPGVTPPRDSDPVRIAVIGTGGMGTEHSRALTRFLQKGTADVQVVALCDVCVPRLTAAYDAIRKLGATHDIALYTDYRKVLADPSIHGVLIAVPEHWHGRMAEEAMIAGKDVYMEKPMTLRLKQAMHLREVARRNPDRIAVVGTQYTTYATYLEAQRLLAADTIGKPIFSQTSYCRNSKNGEWLYKLDPEWKPGENLDWRMWLGKDSPKIDWNPEVFGRWRRYKDFSTGIIGDLLVHYMTPLVMALDVGWPTRVVASGGHYIDKTMEDHDQVNINAEFEKDHTMVIAGSTSNELGLETLIRGHRANMYLTSKKLTIRPEQAFTEEVDPHEFTAPDSGDPQDALRMQWIDAIRSRVQPVSTIELGTKIMVIVDLATRSMWTGKAFGFDPVKMRVREI